MPNKAFTETYTRLGGICGQFSQAYFEFNESMKHNSIMTR